MYTDFSFTMNNCNTQYRAIHILSSEMGSDIASNCKHRSKFMHEKIIECKSNNFGSPVTLVISADTLDVYNSDSQNPDPNSLLMTHSMSRITYSACDKSSAQFALVTRSPADHGSPSHFCHFFRMNSPEQAENVNRLFGQIFKELHARKRQRKSESVAANSSAAASASCPVPVAVTSLVDPIPLNQGSAAVAAGENTPSAGVKTRRNTTQLRQRSSEEDELQKKLRRISSPMIEDLVAEKNARRLSLCMLNNSATPLPGDICYGGGPVNRSGSMTSEEVAMDNPVVPMQRAQGNGASARSSGGPVRKRRPDNGSVATVGGAIQSSRSNRFSAVFERLSFRASRDVSVDALKTGSPVVALKERIEAGKCPEEVEVDLAPHPVATRPQQNTQLSNQQAHNEYEQYDLDNESSRLGAAVLCGVAHNGDHEEQPEFAPVPPVRIHSLRTATNAPFQPHTSSPLVSMPMVASNSNNNQAVNIQARSSNPNLFQEQQQPVSPITTPSSSESEDGSDVDKPIRTQPSASPKSYTPRLGSQQQPQRRLQQSSESPLVRPSSSVGYKQTQSSTAGQQPQPQAALQTVVNIAPYYFGHFSKEDATDYLIEREVGSFLVRDSASHPGSLALSVRISSHSVSHYIVQRNPSNGLYRIRGLDNKAWPSLASLVTHLSVMPEILPCQLLLTAAPGPDNGCYDNNSALPGNQPQPVDQYQQLSEFSTMIASLDIS